MPDYKFIVDFISRFDKKGLDEFIKQTEKAGISVKNLEKKTKKQSDTTDKSTRRHRRFRMELLGIMFAGQRIAKHFGDMIKPAEDLIGLHEMEAALLAEKFLPLAEEQMDALEKEMDRWDSLTDAQKANEIAIAKWGKKFGEALDFAGAALLGINSGLEIIRKIPDDIESAKDAFDTMKTKISEIDWKTMFTDVGSGFKDVFTKSFGDIKDDWGDSSKWEKVGTALGSALTVAATAALTYELFLELGKLMASALGLQLAQALLVVFASVLGIVGGLMIAGIITAPLGVALVAIGAAVGAIAAAAMLPTAMQHGGIVTRPTHALIGEAGPEAVIPLSKMGGMGNITISMSVYTTSSLSKEEIPALTREIAERLGTELREIRMGKVL